MGELRVRNVDEAVILEWRARARRHGRSLAEEIRGVLTDEAMRPRREAVAELRQMHEAMRAEHGELPDSTPDLRADRDGRG